MQKLEEIAQSLVSELFTIEDLNALERMNEILNELDSAKAKELEFHKSVWTAALDATGYPLFSDPK